MPRTEPSANQSLMILSSAADHLALLAILSLLARTRHDAFERRGSCSKIFRQTLSCVVRPTIFRYARLRTSSSSLVHVTRGIGPPSYGADEGNRTLNPRITKPELCR